VYVFVIWDSSREELFCCRDHFGVKALFYHDCCDYTVFSSEIDIIGKIHDFKIVIDENWIANCLISVNYPLDKTPFHGILRLEPASYLRITKSKTRSRFYWTLKRKKEYSKISEEQASILLKRKLHTAVENCIKDYDSIGCELSGGLDSSGISSLAHSYCSETGSRLELFSHVLPNEKSNSFPFTDETKYVNMMVKYLGVKHVNSIAGYDTGALEAIEKSLGKLSLFSITSYSMMSDLLYMKAENRNISIMLSGFGGDEVVTSSAAGYFEELAINLKWVKLKHELNSLSNKSRVELSKLMALTIIRAFVPINISRSNSRIILRGWRLKRYNSFAINEHFAKRLHTKRIFRSGYRIPDYPNVRKRQIRKILNSRIYDRIEISNILGKQYDIEYRYPMLDIDLIELHFGFKSSLKWSKGIGRYIYRKAIESSLPSEICWRNDKMSSTIPNIQYRYKQDIDKFKSLIEEGRFNNKFHYVDYDKMIWMMDQLLLRDSGNRIDFAPNAFFNHSKILILQKWQREGKIDIGIKC